MNIKTVKQRKERKREEMGGKRGGKTSTFEGFLSLWWIDRENRGSHKESCKNRIAPLPGHLSSFPIYLITSPLDALSPFSTFTCAPLFLLLLFSACYSVSSSVSFSPPHPLIPNPNEKQNPLHPSRFAPHHTMAIKTLKHFAVLIPGGALTKQTDLL